MRGRLAAVGLLTIAALSPAEVSAGAFTLQEGEAKLFVSGLLTSGDQYFDRGGRLRPRASYRKYDLQGFLEHGFRDGLTLIASTTLERIYVIDSDRARRDGLGRSEFGLRARLLQENGWIVSAQGSVVIAGAKRNDGVAAIGETDDQFDVRGLVARTFDVFGKPAFLDLQAGYRFRSAEPADEARFDATFGVRASPRWLLLAQSFNTIGLGRWSGEYPLKQRIHKLQGAALFDMTQRLTLFSSFFVTPFGRDAMDERGGQIGFGYRF